MASAPILGIDFGTTNTAAAFFDAAGKLKVVPVSGKNHLLPSVAWFHAGDKAIVGQAARTQIIDDPRHTVFGLKRFLGRRYASEFVTMHKDRFAFDLVPGDDGYAAIEMYGTVHPLAYVAQLIVKQIVTLANHASERPFTECVLTVPAHATIKQRDAIRAAAQAAGLKVRAMLNEPTAAALYYANLRNPEQTVLVFDLGGGTLDVTLLSVQNRVVKVLGTGGDSFLGGANFDERIVEVLVDRFESETGVRIRDNKIVMQRLAFAAETAKIALSSKDETRLRVPCIAQKDGGEFVHFDYAIKRTELEDMVTQLVERAAGVVSDVLEQSGKRPQDIDELVLVGGQTRMPAIRSRFKDFKQSPPDKNLHPDLGVAIGAAILGRNLARSNNTGLVDVLPMPIGVMGPGIGSLDVIGSNTPLPAVKTVPLDKLPPGNVPVVLFEALDRTSIDRELLGTAQIPADWRAANPGSVALELRVGYDFVICATAVSEKGERLDLKLAQAA